MFNITFRCIFSHKKIWDCFTNHSVPQYLCYSIIFFRTVKRSGYVVMKVDVHDTLCPRPPRPAPTSTTTPTPAHRRRENGIETFWARVIKWQWWLCVTDIRFAARGIYIPGPYPPGGGGGSCPPEILRFFKFLINFFGVAENNHKYVYKNVGLLPPPPPLGVWSGYGPAIWYWRPNRFSFVESLIIVLISRCCV